MLSDLYKFDSVDYKNYDHSLEGFFVPLPLGGESLWLDLLECCLGLSLVSSMPCCVLKDWLHGAHTRHSKRVFVCCRVGG